MSHGSCTFQYCCPAAEPGEGKTNLNGDKSPGRSHPSILLTAVVGREGFGLLWEAQIIFSVAFFSPCGAVTFIVPEQEHLLGGG